MTFEKTGGKLLVLSVLSLFYSLNIWGQRYLSDFDSSSFYKDTVMPVVRRMENLHFSGYIQPQFQWTEKRGAPSYEGGNFSEFANNRFMLRRARVKLDYFIRSKNTNFPIALFAFQVDATERGVNVRDMFLRLYEGKKRNFSLTSGLFARPFGYEVNLSSAYRETPERGRASQILMPGERDMGAMITYDKNKRKAGQLPVKFDLGLFNGQGTSGPVDFDSFKDLISRLTLKPYKFSDHLVVSGGLSLLNGGWRQSTKFVYEYGVKDGLKSFLIDSSEANTGKKAPRTYYGADLQLVLKHGWGKTELRSEYWKGKQPGTASTTVNPGVLPSTPTYIRNFDAAFILFLQNVISQKWELMAKYDWYDPNTKVKNTDLGKSGSNFTVADVRYHTVGLGLTHYIRDNLKILGYYSLVKNEKTLLPGFLKDVPDDVLTIRMQLRF